MPFAFDQLLDLVGGDLPPARAEMARAEELTRQRLGSQRGADAVATSQLVVPRIRVLHRLTADDVPSIDAELADALRLHRSYWGQDRGMNRGDRPLREHPSGFASYLLACAIVVARDRGIAVHVRSEYTPTFMLAAT